MLSLSVAIGLAASACYWVTMISELNWIRADNIKPDPSVDYRTNFVLSSFSPDLMNVWWMNILLLGTIAMFWPAVVLLRRPAGPAEHPQNSARTSIKPLAICLLLTIFMATPASRPIWRVIHALQQTQFPWRWFSITSLVCPILLALALPFWTRLARGKKRPLVLIACSTVAISLAFSVFHFVREARRLAPAEFQQTLSRIPGTPGVPQWLPVWANEPLPQMSTQVEVGDRQLTIQSWEPERRVFSVSAGSAIDARVRTFFYPHWQASSAGRTLAVHPDPNGALVVVLPAESSTVTLEFREPLRVRYAIGLTILGWGLIARLLLKQRQLSAS